MSSTYFNPSQMPHNHSRTHQEGSPCGTCTVRRENLNQHLSVFTARMQLLADEILCAQANRPCGETAVIRHYHYYNDPFWFWTPIRPVYVGPVVVDTRSRNERRKDNERDNAILIGVVAAVVAGVAIFAVAGSLNRKEDAERELGSLESDRQILSLYTAPDNDYDIQQKASMAMRAVELKERICQRLSSSANTSLLNRALALGASLTTLGVAVLVPPVALTAGVISTLVVGGKMLFDCGYDSTDKQNFRDAAELNQVLGNLR